MTLLEVGAHRPPTETALERFLRYAAIDTQSAEGATAVPSTTGQLDLARLLVGELTELGAEDVWLTETGIVYGSVPGNLEAASEVPVVGFIAHLDTAPAVSGANVEVIVHREFRGGDIVLPRDPAQVIAVDENPALRELIGDDIITADGTTLLGSDDKAGIAEILTMVDTLRQNPQVAHGRIAIAFTPDEEPGGGVDAFDIERFGAAFAYTVDGEGLGVIYDETWNARTATVTVTGRNAHAGSAKGVLVNSMFALADFLTRFPRELLPEATEGRAGFIHPAWGSIDVEESVLTVGLRDFDQGGLDAHERVLRDMAAETQAGFPDVRIAVDIKDAYRNMNEVLRDHPQVIEHALEATRRAGLTPVTRAIRGGTDGAALSFRGLPTPDLFTGGYNFHSRLEFNSRRGLEKTTETLVHLVRVVAESALPSRQSGADV